MTSGKPDPKQAELDARSKQREKGTPPHWLRCDWYQGVKRCRLGDGHGGEHEFEKEKAND